MAAALSNITVERGTDYYFTLTIKDALSVVVDLSYGAASNVKAQIRRRAGRPLEASFTAAFVTDGTDGKVTLTLPDTETLKLTEGNHYEYDVFWTDSSGNIHRLLYGDVTVKQNITVL